MRYFAHIDRGVYMGKQTLFHPVSLYVIRGSLDRCGFTPGRVRRVRQADDQIAHYWIKLLSVPLDCQHKSPRRIMAAVQSCFAEDITVIDFIWDSKTGYSVEIETRVIFQELERS